MVRARSPMQEAELQALLAADERHWWYRGRRRVLAAVLDRLELPRSCAVLDAGCGSGVLAIAAAKLGLHPVTALDSDPTAMLVTLENARANGVTLDRVDRVDLRREAAPAAGILAANLTRPLLLRVAELMCERPDALIASGLLDAEADEVAGAFAPLRESRRVSEAGWSALLLERRTRAV